MVGELVDGAKPRIRDSRSIEPRDGFHSAQLTEHRGDGVIERRPMAHAIAVCPETFVVGKLRTTKYVAAKAHPFTPILDRQIDRAALAGVVGSVRSDRRMV